MMIALTALLIPRAGKLTPTPVAIGPTSNGLPSVANGTSHPAFFQPLPTEIVITRIFTEPNISHRLAVKPQAESWQRLNDDDLMAQLAAAGHPAGLAIVDGREMILFRNPPVDEHS
jgi:hypothetical protein